MNATTLKALKSSIKHWERLAAWKQAPNEGIYANSCPLCKLFKPTCDGCPVANAGHNLCEGSPWNLASYRFRTARREKTEQTIAEFAAEAKKELAFLKSLLPHAGKETKP